MTTAEELPIEVVLRGSKTFCCDNRRKKKRNGQRSGKLPVEDGQYKGVIRRAVNVKMRLTRTSLQIQIYRLKATETYSKHHVDCFSSKMERIGLEGKRFCTRFSRALVG